MGEVYAVALSADGKRIVSGVGEGALKVWDAAKGQPLLTLRGHSFPVTAVALSTDGKRIVSGSQDGTLKVWDADTGRAMRTLKGHAGAVHSVALGADGRTIVSGGEDKAIKVWRATTRAPPTGHAYAGPSAGAKARRTASTRAASWCGRTVRTSRRTRPPRTRPMTAGLPVRNR